MKYLKPFLKWGCLLAIWIAIFGTLILFYYFKGLPSLSELELQGNKQIVQINYQNGDRITNRGEIYRDNINYYELPQHLINAVVATEDRKFFRHYGVDIFGILRATYVNQKAGRIVQGGSTITQQLAKLLFLSSERTIKRKIQELMLAVQLENNFTKEQILTFYLNRAYFGSGNYGVANAAKNYFNKDISKINLNESAMLAGLLKAPSKYSPKNNRKLAQRRANIVLQNMINAGFVTEEHLIQLDQDPNYKMDHAQKLYFADFVNSQLQEFKLSEQQEISVITSLSKEIQDNLEDELDAFVVKNSKRLGKSQIAIVVMGQDGAVLGMSGGKDYQKSQFNRAVSAKRQAGSAFKTFAYLAAFESGMDPYDLFVDEKINIGSWVPENYDSKYFGEVTLKTAFAKSLNSVAIKISQKVGGSAIASVARKCGISSKIDKDDPTIALGTTEVSLLEMTAAYATISNGGEPVIPYSILSISDEQNNSIYERQSSGFGSVFSEESVNDVKLIMREAVESGSGRRANVANDIYGKTGTSQDFRDAWFVGFDDRYVVGVWIGNDDNSATKKITGGSLPAALFAKIIGKI